MDICGNNEKKKPVITNHKWSYIEEHVWNYINKVIYV